MIQAELSEYKEGWRWSIKNLTSADHEDVLSRGQVDKSLIVMHSIHRGDDHTIFPLNWDPTWTLNSTLSKVVELLQSHPYELVMCKCIEGYRDRHSYQ